MPREEQRHDDAPQPLAGAVRRLRRLAERLGCEQRGDVLAQVRLRVDIRRQWIALVARIQGVLEYRGVGAELAHALRKHVQVDARRGVRGQLGLQQERVRWERR